MRWAFLLVAALVLGGCLGFGNSEPDYEAEAEAVNTAATPILVGEHGDGAHTDAELHNGSFNVELIGYHNGIDDSGDTGRIPAAGTYNELAMGRDHVYLSRGSPDGSFGGFSIINIAEDPSQPRRVGEFNVQGGGDLEVNGDETLVFFATQRNSVDQVTGGIQDNQDPRAGLPFGIYVVNVADKRAPSLDSFIPLPPNGPHTLTYFRHPNGMEYVLACTYDLLRNPQDSNEITGVVSVTQRVIIYQVNNPVNVPGGPRIPAGLAPVAQFQNTESVPAGKLSFPHDTRVQVHPTYGGGASLLMYVAYWDKGMRVVDITAPMAPTEVGFFTDFGPSAYNNLHLVQPFDELIDGKHITVAEPEIISADGETGQMTFLDTSEPEQPMKLGHWTLPLGAEGQLGVRAFDFSPHNFDLWDGKMAIAHNHAGVWVVDVSNQDNLEQPKSVGYYMTAQPRMNSPSIQPHVWGVFEQGGLLYASDVATGLYVLKYTGP